MLDAVHCVTEMARQKCVDEELLEFSKFYHLYLHRHAFDKNWRFCQEYHHGKLSCRLPSSLIYSIALGIPLLIIVLVSYVYYRRRRKRKRENANLYNLYLKNMRLDKYNDVDITRDSKSETSDRKETVAVLDNNRNSSETVNRNTLETSEL